MKLKMFFMSAALILTFGVILAVISNCSVAPGSSSGSGSGSKSSGNASSGSSSSSSSSVSLPSGYSSSANTFWGDDSANWAGETFFWGYPETPEIPSQSVSGIKKSTTVKGSFNYVKANMTPPLPYAVDPIFNPVQGTYTVPKKIQIKSTTSGAVIHYTTNGSDPTSSSPVLTSLTLSNGTVIIKAIATASGMNDSRVVQAIYYFQPAVPVGTTGDPAFSPAQGTYNTNMSVQIKSQTTGAKIYYTINGPDPTTASPVYSSAIPLPLSGTTVIKALAVKSGLANSAIVTQTFTVTGTVSDPVFTLIDNPAGKSISIASATAGANIYYTLDGSVPNELSTLYSDAIPLPGGTIMARAFITGWIASHTVDYSYSTTGKTANPVFSIPGGTYSAPFSLSLSCSTPGSSVLWSLDGGNSWNWNQSNSVYIASNTTVIARAVRTGYNDSDSVTNSYMIPVYTVTYVANGAASGSVPVDGKSYIQGAIATVLGNTGGLVNSGYTFAGWNTKADGTGTGYAAGSTFTMGSANVTLYAVWTQNITYNVTYDANGAGGGNVPLDGNNYLQGATVTVSGNTGNLAKSGYAFTGWNTKPDGTGTAYPAGATFTMGSANIVLYADWVATYTVTYNANGATGGSVPVDGNNYLPGATATVLGNTGNLINTCYYFANWNTKPDGTGVSYPAGSLLELGNFNITLYASWFESGLTWTSGGTLPNKYWISVAYGNGLFVAVANGMGAGSTAVEISPDGINWITGTLPSSCSWNSVTYGNGIFVAVSGLGWQNKVFASSNVVISQDGINWTAVTIPQFFHYPNWKSVAYGNGVFVAVSGVSLYGGGNVVSNVVITSPDGINWTPHATMPASASWNSVTYGNGVFVAIAGSGAGSTAVASSPDGINWTASTLPVGANWSSITYGKGTFVAVGDQQMEVTSPDGINWTYHVIPGNNFVSITYGNGVFVAVNCYQNAATSTDGINWTPSLLPSSCLRYSIAYGNGVFVTVNILGEIAISH